MRVEKYDFEVVLLLVDGHHLWLFELQTELDTLHCQPFDVPIEVQLVGARGRAWDKLNFDVFVFFKKLFVFL